MVEGDGEERKCGGEREEKEERRCRKIGRRK